MLRLARALLFLLFASCTGPELAYRQPQPGEIELKSRSRRYTMYTKGEEIEIRGPGPFGGEGSITLDKNGVKISGPAFGNLFHFYDKENDGIIDHFEAPAGTFYRTGSFPSTYTANDRDYFFKQIDQRWPRLLKDLKADYDGKAEIPIPKPEMAREKEK